MKLVEFKGTGIRGYMNHHIHFKESVTFLVGINGSGKTSILKLISGLTKPSYKTLEAIEYSSVELTLTHDTRTYIISSTKTKDELTIKCNHVEREFKEDTISRIKKDQRGIIDPEELNSIALHFEHLSACQMIMSLSTPIFIGIDRIPEQDVLRFLQRRRLYHFSEQTAFSTVDSSLNTIQEVVFDLYRKNATRQKKYAEDFRTSVLKEALGLITTNDYRGGESIDVEDELSKYESQKSQFVQALTNAGIDDAITMTDNFFKMHRENLDILSGKSEADDMRKNQAIVGWYVSKAQMDKIGKIIEHETTYETNVNKLNEVFERFLECANLFFKESGKEITILDNGLMRVGTSYYNSDGHIKRHLDELTSLSSGEKQIVALIGSLIFTSSNVRPEVIVIDEPELSLHLTWQEIFVDAILKAQPNFQFVLATHSPTIIAKIERREWCEDLSRPLIQM